VWTSSGCVGGLFESRRTVNFPEEEELALGQKAFDHAILARPLSQNVEQRHMVERVGQRLVRASARADLRFQAVLVAGPKAEAVCLPGGKMIVSEGMLALCENEAGLAAVLSHELAHVVANHGHQRAVSHVPASRSRKKADPSEIRRQAIEAGYGLSSGSEEAAPFAHNHEAEADSIGLQLMAKAGYDPREAPRLWERLAAQDRQNRPEFARVHPANADRVAAITKILPTAMTYYNQSTQVGLGMAIVIPPAPASPAKGEIALASHEEPAAKSSGKLIRTADVSGSNDPFLGSPPPQITAPAASAAPVSVAKVELQPVNEPAANKFAAAVAQSSLVPPASAIALPVAATSPGGSAPAAPAKAESSAPAWGGGVRSPEPESRGGAEPRWARPVPADPATSARVPRPATDLSAAPLMPAQDDWQTTRESRPNPFAGR